MELSKVALSIRRRIVLKAIEVGTGHIASALSIVDLLTYLYFKKMNIEKGETKDKFVLSKGHSALALYACLVEKGLLSEEDFDSYHVNGGKLTSFPSEPFFEGLNFSCGSLGHGLSTSLGFALAQKLKKTDAKVFCIISDGECQEGSVWEAALFAGHHKLDNLCVIIDSNKFQALGEIENILTIEPLKEKWLSFGFEVVELNGHSFLEIEDAFNQLDKCKKPLCIIANCVKGKGLSFMENQFAWHYLPIKDELIDIARKELSL